MVRHLSRSWCSAPIGAWLAPVLIVGLAFAIYANGLKVPFLFDDYPHIVRNQQIERLSDPWHYLLRPRGLVSLTLALNHYWGGRDVWGYHVVNVVVHTVNGVLVYALVLSTLHLPFFSKRYARAATPLALLVSAAFVVHPLQTMATTYIIQRAESLAALFVFGALLAFLCAAATRKRGLRWGASAGAVVAAQLGMLTKETAVVIPALALWYDYCFLANGRLRTVGWRSIVHVALWASLAYPLWLSWRNLAPAPGRPVAAAAQSSPHRAVPRDADHNRKVDLPAEAASAAPGPGEEIPAPPSWLEIPTAGLSVREASPWKYSLTQFGVVVWYLRLYALPTQLCFDYGWPFVDSVWRLDVALPFAVLCAIAVAALLSFRRYRLASFCVGWVFLTLAPTSSIVPLKDAAFEHRMYLPMAGLAWLTVVGGYDALGWIVRRTGLRERYVWGTALAATVVWLAILSVLTVRRNELLRDPLALAADSARKSPHHWRPRYDLGNELLKRRRWNEAIAAFEEAIRCDPDQGPPRIHLAQLYLHRGRFAEAETQLRAATEAEERSTVAAAHRQLGFMYLQQGQWDRAQAALSSAADLMPQWSFVRKHLGRLYARQGRWADAAAAFDAAVRLNPEQPPALRREATRAHYQAGLQQATDGDWRSAARSFHAAITYDPELAAAHQHLAIAHAHLGQWFKAEVAIKAAARLEPANPIIKENAERMRSRRVPLTQPAEVVPK